MGHFDHQPRVSRVGSVCSQGCRYGCEASNHWRVYSSVASGGSKITANWYGKNLGRRRPQHELIAGFAATREGGHQAMGIPRWFEPKLEPKATELLTIKQKFMSNYPSELIHADLFPSTRL